MWKWTLENGATTRETKYGYDDGGNVTWVQVDTGPISFNTYGVSGRPHLLSSNSNGTYGYDLTGRQLTAPQRTVTYKAFDLPKTLTPTSCSAPPCTTTFSYDAFGQRVRKTGPTQDVISIGGLYERRDTGGVIEHVFYVNSEEGTVAQVVYNETDSEEYRRFLETDAIGSIGVTTDEAGQTLGRLYFDPFGRRIKPGGLPEDAADAPSDVKLGFTGHRHDDELGVVDMNGRVYDPVQRRFLTADPYVTQPMSGQSYHRFAYALNNPLRFVDPSGLSVMDMGPDPLVDGPTTLVVPDPGLSVPAMNDDPTLKRVQPSTIGSDTNASRPAVGIDVSQAHQTTWEWLSGTPAVEPPVPVMPSTPNFDFSLPDFGSGLLESFGVVKKESNSFPWREAIAGGVRAWIDSVHTSMLPVLGPGVMAFDLAGGHDFTGAAYAGINGQSAGASRSLGRGVGSLTQAIAALGTGIRAATGPRPQLGGSYSNVRSAASEAGLGGQVHHMPSWAATEQGGMRGVTHGSAPSIWMETADHMLTGSHGSRGRAGAAYRALQADMIRSGRYLDAVKMDIDNIRHLFGSRYDGAIQQMGEYMWRANQ